MLKKQFKVHTKWSSIEEVNTDNTFNNIKTHKVYIEQKSPLTISAAKDFKGDATKHNPEDLLLTALSSCHMMSYFYLCQQQGVELISYSDETIGTLVLKSDGSGAFSAVQLHPIVTISNTGHSKLALSLHEKANQLCFIANSCNFPITHKAEILIQK